MRFSDHAYARPPGAAVIVGGKSAPGMFATTRHEQPASFEINRSSRCHAISVSGSSSAARPYVYAIGVSGSADGASVRPPSSVNVTAAVPVIIEQRGYCSGTRTTRRRDAAAGSAREKQTNRNKRILRLISAG